MMALVSLPGLNESEIRSNMILLALFPGLPSFLFIRFALTVVYRKADKWAKTGKAWKHSSHEIRRVSGCH